jgi:hypothetical protein
MFAKLAGAIASYDRSNSSWGRDKDSDAILTPDVLTPVQYYTAPVVSPYHRLLLAILEDAIRCFQRNFDARDGARRILFHETEEWLFDSRGTAFMSCPSVCESLGIDAARLRRYLHNWRLRKRARQEAPCLARRGPVTADPCGIAPTFIASEDAGSPAR